MVTNEMTTTDTERAREMLAAECSDGHIGMEFVRTDDALRAIEAALSSQAGAREAVVTAHFLGDDKRAEVTFNDRPPVGTKLYTTPPPPDAALRVQLEALQERWCASTAGKQLSRRIATFDESRNARGEDDFDNESAAIRRCASEVTAILAQPAQGEVVDELFRDDWISQAELESRLDTLAEEYEWGGDESVAITERERTLLIDFVHGILADEVFVAMLKAHHDPMSKGRPEALQPAQAGVVVPREPTPEMIEAGASSIRCDCDPNHKPQRPTAHRAARNAFVSMLAAAQQGDRP